jgi:hypothetical protein
MYTCNAHSGEKQPPICSVNHILKNTRIQYLDCTVYVFSRMALNPSLTITSKDLSQISQA